MSLRLDRLYAVLILIWAARHIGATAILPPGTRAIWVPPTLMWIACAIYLIIGRRTVLVYWLVLALFGLEFFAMGFWNKEGVTMLAWLTLVMAVSEGHPEERRFLVRVLATVVYAFAAVTKLNPSWLGGDGVHALVPLHPTLAWTAPVMELQGMAVAAGMLVIAVEGFIAVGLWFTRTRPYAIVIGMVMHTLFVTLLARDVFSLVHLLALNGGLMLCYVAFIEPGPRLRGSTERTSTPSQASEASPAH